MKNNFFNTYASLVNNPGHFFDNMFSEMEKYKVRRRKEEAGIEQNENGLFGVPSLEIPFVYWSLDFENGYFIGKDKTTTFILDSNGVVLCSGLSVEYVGQDFFLVVVNEREKNKSKSYGALYLNGEKLTDDVLATQFNSNFKKDSNFCIFGYEDLSQSCVVSKQGEIVYVPDQKYGYPYLYNNVLLADKKYINLLTCETICKKGCSSQLKAGDLIFVEAEMDSCVYKIDTKTGEYEIFGEPKIEVKKEEKKSDDDSIVSEQKSLPKPLKQSRNDKCACGSGLKYKNCCGKE